MKKTKFLHQENSSSVPKKTDRKDNHMKRQHYLIVLLCLDMVTKGASQSASSNSFSATQQLSVFYADKQLDSVSTNNTKQLPSIAAGAGVLTFNGDVSKGLFTNINAGYNISVEQELNKFVSISLNGMYGTLHGENVINLQHLNFESKIMQGDFNIFFRLKAAISPYLSVGVGGLKFNPYGDLKDANGYTYYYWDDGTIRNLPESETNKKNAIVLTRDYKYETQLNNSTNYSKTTAIIPIGLGMDFKLDERFSLRVGATYYITMSDYIDNYKAGNTNDSYLYSNLSLYYHFSKNKRGEKEDKTAFIKIDITDRDNDGVKDVVDKCQDTPNNIKVDKFGCPIDTDKDGIPDYKDKEPKSEVGSIVNTEGVTLTDQMIAQHYESYKIQAAKESALSQKNQTKTDSISAPKADTLKSKIEKLNQLNLTKEQYKDLQMDQLGDRVINHKTIPSDLKSFDTDLNNEISQKEITQAINSFFDGDKNITINKINELINYFFEQ